jgi:hypothetical protein
MVKKQLKEHEESMKLRSVVSKANSRKHGGYISKILRASFGKRLHLTTNKIGAHEGILRIKRILGATPSRVGLRSAPTTGAESLTDYFLTSTELVAPLAHLEFNFRFAPSMRISANRSP